jgi:steroid Delta-isomerase
MRAGSIEEILARHIALFNQGVLSGDFSQMVNLFSEGAEMSFIGIPVGPFKGRSAISDAYSKQPPDDEIIILSVNKKTQTRLRQTTLGRKIRNSKLAKCG